MIETFPVEAKSLEVPAVLTVTISFTSEPEYVISLAAVSASEAEKSIFVDESVLSPLIPEKSTVASSLNLFVAFAASIKLAPLPPDEIILKSPDIVNFSNKEAVLSDVNVNVSSSRPPFNTAVNSFEASTISILATFLDKFVPLYVTAS